MSRPNPSESPSAIRSGDPFPAILALIPRPLRFLGVGGIGLAVDLSVFTILTLLFSMGPLTARIGSLAVATLVTWRLNRALTFERSGRRLSDEAARYGLVTLAAQGTSYATFATLVLTILATVPQGGQIALVVGAALGAIVSYNGHRLFAFAPAASSSPTR